MPHVDVNLPNIYGHNPLDWAAERGHTTIVELLLDRNAGLAHEPFMTAYKNGHRQLAIQYIDKFVEPFRANIPKNSKYTSLLNSKYHTLLVCAIRTGLPSTVTQLYPKLCDHSSFSQWLIKSAAESGNSNIVRYLLEQEAPLSRGIPMYYLHGPALSEATRNEHEIIVQMLLQHVADPNSEEIDNGITPLDSAAITGQVRVAKLLLKHSTNLTFPRTIPKSPNLCAIDKIRPALAIAAFSGHIAMTEPLLANGAGSTWESTTDGWLEDSYANRKGPSVLVEGSL